MKNIVIKLFAFCLLLLGTNLHAQQDWQWGQRVGVQVEDMTTDSHGNTYVLWDLFGSYTIDGHVINGYGYGQSDIALTSFSCDGTYRWTQVFGTSDYDGGGGSVKTDTLGGVYIWSGVASNGSNPIFVGNDTTIAATRRKIILLKYDTSGNFQWVRMPEPDTLTYPSNIKGMDVAANGDCYLFSLLSPGSYGNGAYIATFPYSYYGNRGSGIYALKYDRNGNCTGGTHFDMYFSGPAFTYTKFKLDLLSGNYYLGGNVGSGGPNDTLIFGNVVITTQFNPDVIGYLAAFDSTGSFLWLQKNDDPSSGNTEVGRPVVDGQGNIYLPGGTATGDSWGGYTFTNNISSLIYRFPFLLKLDPNGNLLWGTNASTNSVSVGAVAAAANGTVGFSSAYGKRVEWGGFSAENTAAHNEGYNVLFTRFNASTGAIISFDTLASSLNNNDFATNMTTDKQGNFYVGGTFEGALYVANDTIYNQSSQQDGFIAKFGNANCNCVLPTAHYTHGSLSNGGVVSFTYDGSQPVDSVIWDFGDNQTATGTTVNHTYTQDGDYTVCATAFNSCGTNMTCQTLHIETGLGIGGFPDMAQLRVFPNPAVQTLTIDGVQPGTQLEIYDGLGRRVLQQQLHSNQETLNVSHLTPGIYLLLFTDENGNKGSVKVVKE